jgi:hypothetical protein
MEGKLFFGGIPTDIEVKALREAYPNDYLKPGMLIDYGDIEKIIGCTRDSNRWRTITDRWRNVVERETGIIIAPDPLKSGAWKVLLEGEKVSLSSGKLRTAGRMARRSYVVASRVDVKQLTDQERTEYDHSVRRSVALLEAARLKAKAVLPEIA